MVDSEIVWGEWSDAEGYQVRIGFWENDTASGPAMATRPMVILETDR